MVHSGGLCRGAVFQYAKNTAVIHCPAILVCLTIYRDMIAIQWVERGRQSKIYSQPGWPAIDELSSILHGSDRLFGGRDDQRGDNFGAGPFFIRPRLRFGGMILPTFTGPEFLRLCRRSCENHKWVEADTIKMASSTTYACPIQPFHRHGNRDLVWMVQHWPCYENP